MALPAKHDITVYAGDEFELVFRLRSEQVYEDLTDKVGRAQVRDVAGDAGVLLAEFTVGLEPQGTVRCTLTAAQTAALTNGVYDVEIANADGTGRRTRLGGKVKVVPQVTR